jgi:Ser-tRNA(Ala) deacylase AlaX
MNQILVSEKLYVTPDMKRKKKMFKVEFFLSVFFAVVLSSYGIYAEYDRNRAEEVSKEILGNMSFQEEKIITKQIEREEILVILNNINKEAKQVQVQEVIQEVIAVPEELKSVANDGEVYYTIGTIKIPKINLNYPILSSSSVELLKIAPNKFWGPNPNEVRKFVYSGS